jgi:DNA-binding MarR family transcriptional regulator
MIYTEFDILSLTVRLDKLADTLRRDASLIYTNYNANFMNKWYPVLIKIHSENEISLTELSTELGYAHPSIIQLVNEMETEKLIKSSAHKKDKRKRIVTLTSKGRKTLKSILPFANAMTQALLNATNTKNNITKAILELENELKKESFYERITTILETNNKRKPSK